MDQSPAIASPHPPHILVIFIPLLDRYYPLTDDANYKLLVSDVVDYVNDNPVPWDGVILDKDKLIEQSTINSLFEINRLIYEAAASAKNASLWCCKSMNNVYYASELEEHQSIQKYIYMYRDGRDVAASFKKAIVGEKHIYFLAKQWKKDQEECLKLKDQLPADRFFSLSYERLISHPEETVTALCDFLNINYTTDMLHYYTSHTSKTTAASGEMWSNLEKPIMKNNSGNFFTSFEDNDLEIFELIAGDTLLKLGYPLYSSSNNPGLISPKNIENYQQQNNKLKQLSLIKAKPGDLEKRAQQEHIIKQIKGRQKLQLS
jgi:hypothetical protein